MGPLFPFSATPDSPMLPVGHSEALLFLYSWLLKGLSRFSLLLVLVPVLLLALFVPRFSRSAYSHIVTMEVACSSETSVDIYHITLRHASEDSNIVGCISFLSVISVRQMFESSVFVSDVTPCSLAIHGITVLTCDSLRGVGLFLWLVALWRVRGSAVNRRQLYP